MRISTQLTVLITTAAIISGCLARNIKPTFIQFGAEYVDYSNNPGKLPAGGIVFFVQNYNDNEFCQNHIDSMAMRLGDSLKNRFITYRIDIYKTSKKTNIENLTANPRDLDRHSNTEDYICNYYWSEGRFSGKQKFENGKLIIPKGREVKISNIP